MESWSRQEKVIVCIEEGCEEPPYPGRRLCREHKNEQAKVERERSRTSRACKPCAWKDESCDQPRVVSASQVSSYCLEHKRATQRAFDTQKRRELGMVERVIAVPPPGVPDGSKWCPGCELIKEHSEFHLDKGKPGGLQAKCKTCQYSRYKERLAENPEAVRAVANRSAKKNRRRYLYGMDEEQFLVKMAEQGGVCASCKRAMDQPNVDHDHACCSGYQTCGDCVRGILCSPCNRGAGFFDDDPVLLRAMADYIERTRREVIERLRRRQRDEDHGPSSPG